MLPLPLDAFVDRKLSSLRQCCNSRQVFRRKFFVSNYKKGNQIHAQYTVSPKSFFLFKCLFVYVYFYVSSTTLVVKIVFL